MPLRIITLTPNASGELADTSTRFGGMQYEDKATRVAFDLTAYLATGTHTDEEYRVDTDSVSAGYFPGNIVTYEDLGADKTVYVDVPKAITQFGGQFTVTLVICKLDDDDVSHVFLTVPITLRLANVSRTDEQFNRELSEYQRYIEGLADEATAKADDAADSAEEASGYANTASSKATEAAHSASLAHGYAEAAELSKLSAAASVTEASGYAAAASDSANDASGYAGEAEASATSAENSATAAEEAAASINLNAVHYTAETKTDAEKAQARKNIGAGIKLAGTPQTPDADGDVDIKKATKTGFGVVKVGETQEGVTFTNEGMLQVQQASAVGIRDRINSHCPVTSNNLNYAVKRALTDPNRIGYKSNTPTTGTETVSNVLALTDAEKDNACNVLGAERSLGDFTLIETVTISGNDTHAVERTKTPGNVAYNYTDFLLTAEIDSWGSASGSVIWSVNINGDENFLYVSLPKQTAKTYLTVRFKIDGGRLFVYDGASRNMTYHNAYGVYPAITNGWSELSAITKIVLKPYDNPDMIPEGTVIKLYGR